MELDLIGNCFDIDTVNQYEVSSSAGIELQMDELPIIGRVYVKNSSNNPVLVFPYKMIASPMYRSNVKGSFKWKGDPRMQPRDVIEFERLDGTTEEITIETITLTHEGGGTSADITYRKGVI